MSLRPLFPMKFNVFSWARQPHQPKLVLKFSLFFFFVFLSFFTTKAQSISPENRDYIKLICKTFFIINYKSELGSEALKELTNISKFDYNISIKKVTVQIPTQQIIKDNDTNSKKTITKLVYTAIGILVLGAILFFIYRKRSNSLLHTKYKGLLDKIQIQQKTEIPDLSDTQDENIPKEQSSNIADETFNAILKKIIKFENSDKYLKKDINLTWLSNHLNTNTKYLSEVIKVHRNKSFNNYINGLRIEYITRQLYENPVYREYKITYLAEECGYASPQVFVIAFKRETGVTPSYFIEQLKDQSNEDYKESIS